MKLRDYQEELVNKAVQTFESHGFVYLALETRTGKTPVSIMAAVEIYRKTGAPEILFVTEKGHHLQYCGYLQKGLCEDYPIADVPFRVMSFDSLHKVTQLDGRIIIADEAHSFGSYPKPSRKGSDASRIGERLPGDHAICNANAGIVFIHILATGSRTCGLRAHKPVQEKLLSVGMSM